MLLVEEETLSQAPPALAAMLIGLTAIKEQYLKSLFPEGPWRIAHIRTLFLHILPTIHNLWTVSHPAEVSVTPPLVSFVMATRSG